MIGWYLYSVFQRVVQIVCICSNDPPTHCGMYLALDFQTHSGQQLIALPDQLAP